MDRAALIHWFLLPIVLLKVARELSAIQVDFGNIHSISKIASTRRRLRGFSFAISAMSPLSVALLIPE
jgi:hypothetical protein